MLLDPNTGKVLRQLASEGLRYFCGAPALDGTRLIALHVRDDGGLYLGIIDLAKELGKEN